MIIIPGLTLHKLYEISSSNVIYWRLSTNNEIREIDSKTLFLSGGFNWPKESWTQQNLNKIHLSSSNLKVNNITTSSLQIMLDLERFILIVVELLLWPRVEARPICRQVWGCLMEAITLHWIILAETEVLITWPWPKPKSGTTANGIFNKRLLSNVFYFKFVNTIEIVNFSWTIFILI